MTEEEREYIRNLTEEEIDRNIAETEELGRRITEYLEPYRFTPMYTEVAMAIQFGMHVERELEEDLNKKSNGE